MRPGPRFLPTIQCNGAARPVSSIREEAFVVFGRCVCAATLDRRSHHIGSLRYDFSHERVLGRRMTIRRPAPPAPHCRALTPPMYTHWTRGRTLVTRGPKDEGNAI